MHSKQNLSFQEDFHLYSFDDLRGLGVVFNYSIHTLPGFSITLSGRGTNRVFERWVQFTTPKRYFACLWTFTWVFYWFITTEVQNHFQGGNFTLLPRKKNWSVNVYPHGPLSPPATEGGEEYGIFSSSKTKTKVTIGSGSEEDSLFGSVGKAGGDKEDLFPPLPSLTTPSPAPPPTSHAQTQVCIYTLSQHVHKMHVISLSLSLSISLFFLHLHHHHLLFLSSGPLSFNTYSKQLVTLWHDNYRVLTMEHHLWLLQETELWA